MNPIGHPNLTVLVLNLSLWIVFTAVISFAVYFCLTEYFPKKESGKNFTLTLSKGMDAVLSIVNRTTVNIYAMSDSPFNLQVGLKKINSAPFGSITNQLTAAYPDSRGETTISTDSEYGIKVEIGIDSLDNANLTIYPKKFQKKVAAWTIAALLITFIGLSVWLCYPILY